MRISFDLDETLICSDEAIPREPPPPWYWRIVGSTEPMRQGTPALMEQLQQRGWETWVYTTSFRSVFSIRRWMRSYGVTLDGVVNQRIHSRNLSGVSGKLPSKNPAIFGIDLHVDDSEGVRMEGKVHGFEVIVVESSEQDWTNQVLNAANGLATKSTESGRIREDQYSVRGRTMKQLTSSK